MTGRRRANILPPMRTKNMFYRSRTAASCLPVVSGLPVADRDAMACRLAVSRACLGAVASGVLLGRDGDLAVEADVSRGCLVSLVGDGAPSLLGLVSWQLAAMGVRLLCLSPDPLDGDLVRDGVRLGGRGRAETRDWARGLFPLPSPGRHPAAVTVVAPVLSSRAVAALAGLADEGGIVFVAGCVVAGSRVVEVRGDRGGALPDGTGFVPAAAPAMGSRGRPVRAMMRKTEKTA